MSIARPLISVLIPTYNRAAWLGECIESVLNQTLSPSEILVVDDGSEDDTESVVGKYVNSGVRYIRKAHTGASSTRNLGIGACEGDYVLTVGSDDVIFSDAVERLSKAYHTYAERIFYYGNLVVTDVALNPKTEIVYPDWKDDEGRLRSALAFTNQIGDGFGMIHRQTLLRLGGYNESYPRCLDWELWIRAGRELKVAHCASSLGYWRWHDQNLSGNRRQHARVEYDRKLREQARAMKSGSQHGVDLGWNVGASAQEGRPVWIWGAGESGRAMWEMLAFMGIDVVAFVDSDRSKVDESFLGLPVLSPDSLDNKTPRPFVMVGSVYEHEIAAALDAKDFREGTDYDRTYGVEYRRLKG